MIFPSPGDDGARALVAGEKTHGGRSSFAGCSLKPSSYHPPRAASDRKDGDPRPVGMNQRKLWSKSKLPLTCKSIVGIVVFLRIAGVRSSQFHPVKRTIGGPGAVHALDLLSNSEPVERFDSPEYRAVLLCYRHRRSDGRNECECQYFFSAFFLAFFFFPPQLIFLSFSFTFFFNFFLSFSFILSRSFYFFSFLPSFLPTFLPLFLFIYFSFPFFFLFILFFLLSPFSFLFSLFHSFFSQFFS
ncbi:unnamed protein product [Acanthosepion pharaonis]|uniref:Uncharacterized protein n=1 Tax=Acanthosepion pharaonis TaxID=158019 RepID=A0A812E582_ACAPH|nr:unnamed protein product [Sepia pharaonis]